MLETVGPTLESIEGEKGFWDPSQSDIEMVQASCKKLSSISFLVVGDEQDLSYANLLISCGSRLRFGALHGMSESHYRWVVVACPKMHCTDNAYSYGISSIARLPVLGSSLKSLSFYVFRDIDELMLASMSKWRTGLENISLRIGRDYCAVATIRALFWHEKPLLNTFHLEVLQTDARGVFQELAPHARTLRQFSFAGQFSLSLTQGAFEAVAHGAPALEAFTITQNMPRGNESIEEVISVAHHAVDIFMTSPCLRHLEVYNALRTIYHEFKLPSEVIANEFVRLRNSKEREIYVIVFGHDYLA